MRILLSFIFSFSITLAALAQNYAGDSWNKVRASGSGTLACVYYPTPGLVYEENGEVKGVCVDILKDFAAYVKSKYGKTVNIRFVGKETAWTDFLDNTLKGTNTLGVANVTITPERKQMMKFSPPYMQNPLIFLTHNTASNLSSIEEISSKLAGYTALTITGSTHVKVMKNLKDKYYPDMQIEYANSGIEVLQKLQDNPKLFTILDFTEYFHAVRKKLPTKRQNVDVGGPKEQLAFIMPKNSDWQPLWQEFLTPAYKRSIAYKKIVANNLGNAFLGMLE